MRDGVVISRHGRTRAAVFPIGIDPQQFAQLAAKASTHPDVSRLRRSLNGEKLAIGVDRLDYSKGLINRIKAFDRMWTLHPQLARTVSLLQIATPSRGAIEAYGNLQSEVAKLVSDVNGLHGEVDWTPIRYLNKGYGQAVLAGLYRTAQVGVVTPLQDGMNLVAKEYVAAQNPVDPGVLVLSKFAGAANELDTALIVNPHDIDGMARTIATALSMPLTERRMRWEAMMAKLRGQHHPAMVRRLHRCAAGMPVRQERASAPIVIAEPPALWPRPLRHQWRRAVSLAAYCVVIRGSVRRTQPSDASMAYRAIAKPGSLEPECIPNSNTTRHPAPGSAPCSARSDFPSAPSPLPLAGEHAGADRRPTICCR